MDSVESHGGKRKRSLSDDGPPLPPLPPPPAPPQASSAAPVAPGNVTQINYFKKARSEKMSLIEGDSDIFNDILSLMADYEGVLERHESIAANLGAKLVGPLLVKSIEKLFEGPIRILKSQYETEVVTITWLDIIECARAKPNSFKLTDTLNGGRVCQFWIKDCLVEISEDDYRLILSGAPERMIPSEPVPEDEIAEVGALEIVEQRLNAMVKKADLVAGHARQLRHRLKSRKAAIQARRSVRQADAILISTYSPDARQPASPYAGVNNRSIMNGDAHAPAQGLHEDLLRQFQSENRKPSTLSPTAAKAKSLRGAQLDSHSHSPITPPQAPNNNLSKKNAQNTNNSGGSSRTQTAATASGEIFGGPHRPAMMGRMEKLARGDAIWPPCDRCRRLRIDCTKYLTACAGCTRKHAKCSWYSITPVEAAWITSGFEGELQNAIAVSDGNGDVGNNNDDGNGPLQHHEHQHYGDVSDPDANLHPDLRSGSANVGAGDGMHALHMHNQHANGNSSNNGEAIGGGNRRSAGSATGGRNNARASPATTSGLIRRSGGRAGRNNADGAHASIPSGSPDDLYFGQMSGIKGGGGEASSSSHIGDGDGELEQHQHHH